MQAEGRVGRITAATGTVNPLRINEEGALVVQEVGRGKYYQSALAGNIYTLNQTAWTTAIAAGHLLAATAAANVQFVLWNPAGSGVNLSLLKFSVNIVSGTLPISGLWHSVGANAPSIASGTLAAGAYINSHNAGVAVYAGKAGYYTHVSGGALTGALIARPLRSTGLFYSAGVFVNVAGAVQMDHLDGDIVLPPNSFWVPQWAAAGTTMLGGYTITWEEVTI